MAKPLCAVVGIGPKNGAAFARTFAAAGYQCGPEGIHVSLLIIDGSIDDPGKPANQPDAKRLRPEDVAREALRLSQQDRSAWTFELDLRPHQENW